MNNLRQIQVLCVDDHPIVLEGLTTVINSQTDMKVVADARDGQTALEKYRDHQPDVVVMDLRLPGIGGVEATARIRQEFPAARIIILTMYEGDEDIHRALEAGAQAYLLKNMMGQTLLQTIREVQAGRRAWPNTLLASR
jgi:DNA-binding NarL/FixJ family response regulator